MAPTSLPFNRNALDSMKRADIQKLCKDYGVKANLKTEALIELLLDTVQNLRPLAADRKQPPPANPPVRRASTRLRAASQATNKKTQVNSSRTVQGDDRTDNEQRMPRFEDTTQSDEEGTLTEPQPPSRIRKAKDVQSRLGVGRPVAAGGRGARAAKQSGSINTRGKNNVSTQPVEAAIAEEPLPTPITNNCEVVIVTPSSGPSRSRSDSQQETPSRGAPLIETTQVPSRELASQGESQDYDDGRSLHAQLDLLKRALDAQREEIESLRSGLQALQAEVDSLRPQVARASCLEGELNSLKGTVALAMAACPPDEAPSITSRPNRSPAKGNNNRHTSVPLAESDTNSVPRSLKPSPLVPAPPAQLTGKSAAMPAPLGLGSEPGPAATALGKRHRDSISSNMTGVIEAGDEDHLSEKDLAKRVIRPNKKRARLNIDEDADEPDSNRPISFTDAASDDSGKSRSTAEIVTRSSSSAGESSSHPMPGTPPPTIHLPDYFGGSTEQSGHLDAPFEVAMTGFNDVPHRANPFMNFSFSATTTSTPMAPHHTGINFGLPPIPFSPGSAVEGSRANPFGGRHVPSSSGRHIQPFGTLAQARMPFGDVEHVEEQYVNPSVLARSSLPLLEDDSYIRGFGHGVVIPATQRSDDSPARPMQKTMYGTELADDTRFGDFGRDGIASGSSNFWTRF